MVIKISKRNKQKFVDEVVSKSKKGKDYLIVAYVDVIDDYALVDSPVICLRTTDVLDNAPIKEVDIIIDLSSTTLYCEENAISELAEKLDNDIYIITDNKNLKQLIPEDVELKEY